MTGPGRPPLHPVIRKYQVIPVTSLTGRPVHGQLVAYEPAGEGWEPYPDHRALCGVRQRLVTAGWREKLTCPACLRKAVPYWVDFENYLAPGEERKGR